MRNRFPTLIIIAILLTLNIAHAENIAFVKEYTYQASEFDSKHSSRILALEQLKRSLLEELGTYLISETEVKDFHLTKDQITIYTAGIVMTEVVDEKWDGKSYWLKARLSADSNEVVKSIDAIRQDIKKSRELYIAQKRADELEKELKRLKKELTEKPDGIKIKEYNDKINKLNALDWLKLAFTNLEGSEENIKANPQKIKDAVDALTKVIEIVPNYSLAFYFRGLFIAGYLNDYERAIEDFNKAIEYNYWNEKDINIKKDFEPEEIEDIIKDTRMIRAFAYFKLNKFSEGIRGLEDVFNHYYYSNNDFTGLWEEKDFNNYISKYPKDYRGYLFRGIYFDKTLSWSDKKYKELAIQDFRKVVSLKSDLAIGYYYLAHFYWIEKNDINLALKAINKAVKLKSTPKVASLVFNLKADMHSDLRQYNEALKSYAMAIDSFPEYADNYFNRGFFFDRNKKYREAINDYTSAINAKIRILFGAKGMKAVSLGLLNRADAYQKIGDYNKAVDDYSKSIEIKLKDFEGSSLNPYEFLTIHFAGRGKALFNLGEYKSAIDDFTKIIEVNPDSSATEYEYRGKSYSRLQRYKEAIDDFDKVIEWWKKNYKGSIPEGIYTERGLAYLQIGDFKNALSNLDLAIQIDPEDFVAYSNRGITYLNIGNSEQAVKDFNHALKLSQKNPTIYTLRGNAFYNLGRLTDAIKDYTTAITINPSADSAYYGRGMAYVAQKNNQQAMNDILVSARLGNPSAQDYLTKLGITW